MATKEMTESTEMTTCTGYGLSDGVDMLGGDLADEFAGLDFRFDKIKLPAGGVTAFEVPDPDNDGETMMVKSIEGVILYQHAVNSFYRSEFKGGSNPPDCGSFDGVVGVGDPGGKCSQCPYNQFGSAGGGSKGKACKNRRMLYILMEGDIFPYQLSLPTGSLREYTQYAKSLLNKKRSPSQVVTKISLKKASSSTDIEYSQATFSKVRDLTADEKAAVASRIAQVKEYASGLTVASFAQDDDYNPFVDPETGEIIEAM